ncbi:hypothetical protein CP8484711_1867A, partial [Chlamydia psittaci 84-8471/1]
MRCGNHNPSIGT